MYINHIYMDFVFYEIWLVIHKKSREILSGYSLDIDHCLWYCCGYQKWRLIAKFCVKSEHVCVFFRTFAT